MKKLSWISVACCLAMTACVADEADGGAEQVQAQAPTADRADGLDSRDHDCQLVLREVQRPKEEDGSSQVECGSRFCWYVIEGTFDVAPELAAEGEPGVLFRSREGDWFEAEAQLEANVDQSSGFERYSFRLTENTIREGTPASTLYRANLALVPFVRIGERRIFDGNGTEEEAYPLRGHEDFAVEQDAELCVSVGGVRQLGE